jgi:hypothetical protein
MTQKRKINKCKQRSDGQKSAETLSLDFLAIFLSFRSLVLGLFLFLSATGRGDPAVNSWNTEASTGVGVPASGRQRRIGVECRGEERKAK